MSVTDTTPPGIGKSIFQQGLEDPVCVTSPPPLSSTQFFTLSPTSQTPSRAKLTGRDSGPLHLLFLGTPALSWGAICLSLGSQRREQMGGAGLDKSCL